MGKSQRTKGHSYERRIARYLRRIFADARRNVTETQVAGQGVDLVNTGNLAIQCKCTKRYPPINKIEEVAGDGIPVLIAKGDNKRDVAVLYLEDFLSILEDVGVVYNDR